jgi:hypothetical protein
MEQASKKISQYVLGLAIIAMGLFGYFSDLIPNKEIFLGLFLVYGIWRLYRGYKM